MQLYEVSEMKKEYRYRMGIGAVVLLAVPILFQWYLKRKGDIE